MAQYKIFFRMDGEEPEFESEEEVNKELEMIYLATDGEFIVTKDGKYYCTGNLDKETGYDIKKLNCSQSKPETKLKKSKRIPSMLTDGEGAYYPDDSHNHSKEQNKNPAHFCMGYNCNKFLGYRGFCSDKCHNSHYAENKSEGKDV